MITGYDALIVSRRSERVLAHVRSDLAGRNDDACPWAILDVLTAQLD